MRHSFVGVKEIENVSLLVDIGAFLNLDDAKKMLGNDGLTTRMVTSILSSIGFRYISNLKKYKRISKNPVAIMGSRQDLDKSFYERIGTEKPTWTYKEIRERIGFRPVRSQVHEKMAELGYEFVESQHAWVLPGFDRTNRYNKVYVYLTDIELARISKYGKPSKVIKSLLKETFGL